MDRRVTNRLNMANVFIEVCDARTAIVALVPAFVLLVADLKTRRTALQNLMLLLSTGESGYGKDKTKWRENLVLRLSVLCGIGASYAEEIEDPVLYGKFNYSETTIKELRDTELIEKANSLIALQATVETELEPYGITTTFMTDLTTALDNFVEKNPKPIANIAMTEADNEKLLDAAFDLSGFVLGRVMKAATIYKLLDSNFYDALKAASLIRNPGLRHELTPEEAAARKEENRLKKEAKAKEKADKEAAKLKEQADKEAAKLQEQAKAEAAKLLEAAEKNPLQEPSNITELLGSKVQEINTAPATSEAPATLEPSQNGHTEA